VLLVCVLTHHPNNSLLYVCFYFVFIYSPPLSLFENITIPYHRKKGSYKRSVGTLANITRLCVNRRLGKE
jgi:hypothetical protein